MSQKLENWPHTWPTISKIGKNHQNFKKYKLVKINIVFDHEYTVVHNLSFFVYFDDLFLTS